MNNLAFFDFLLRSTLIWSIVFLTYKLVLGQSKWHNFNRMLLLSFLLLPFVLPFISLEQVSTAVPLLRPIDLPELELNLENTVNQISTINYLAIYLSISVFFLLKHSIGFYKTYRLKSGKPAFYYKNHKIYEIEDNTAFNFLNQIYIGKELKENQNILDHEIIHKTSKHSLDILLITILRSVFWIFPFWNKIAQLFKENHEYYVDHKLLQTTKLSDYLKQIALAGPIKFDEQFGLTSNQMSIFKTRLQMMKNNHKSQIWRYLLMFGISGAIFVACDKTDVDMDSQAKSDKMHMPPPPPIRPSEERSLLLKEVDVLPTWQGCNDGDQECFNKGMMNFIIENFEYPPAAKANGVEGKAFVGFQFSSTGEIRNIALRRKTDSKELNKEALRLVKLLPNLEKPAYKDGKPVAVQYTLPINFKIK